MSEDASKPLTKADCPEAKASHSNRPGTQVPALLLIEDDPAVAALIQEALRTFFLVDVLIAATPDQARSLWRQQRDGSIAAILSDLNLPGENGLSVVRELTKEGPDVLGCVCDR